MNRFRLIVKDVSCTEVLLDVTLRGDARRERVRPVGGGYGDHAR